MGDAGTMTPANKILIASTAAFAVLIVGLAIVGGVLAYSPVPYKDMWDGYLGFYEGVQRENPTAWWYQHNEHRIVLARVLFWIDLAWLNGRGWFLILANYLLVGLSAVMYWRILRSLDVREDADERRLVLGLFLTAWLFLWIQHENFTWGFQSAFFLAQLLPLTALYWLQKSAPDHPIHNFAIACCLGVASAGTMANGVLALPLMTIFAIVAGLGAVRIVILAVLSGTTLFYYFHTYLTVGHHGTLLQALRQSPLDVIQYVLLYLGSPFYYLAGGGTAGHFIGVVAGAALIACTVWSGIRLLRERQNGALKLALLFFLLYLGGTALGTAGGRLAVFGLDQALSSRYTTPAIMAWATLLALYAPELTTLRGSRKKLARIALVAVMVLMLPLQLPAARSQAGELFERSVAALALALQIGDQKQIAQVYPAASDAIARAEAASAKGLSIFGMFPFREAREQMGTYASLQALPACAGHLDLVEDIEGDPRFLRVQGWLLDTTAKSKLEIVRMLDARGKVVGYALGGALRPDVAGKKGKNALRSGFRGYLVSASMGDVVTLQGSTSAGSVCNMRADVPYSFLKLSKEAPSLPRGTISTRNLLADNQWQGSDYFRSVIEGMKVYGSYIHSDADTGSIRLSIKQGDRLFYRSGPTGGRQSLEIFGSKLPVVKLPVAPDWVLLEFTGASLPGKEFVVKLSDDGNAWGEWSAIAVKEHD